MRRMMGLVGLMALALGACGEDTINNARSAAYLIDGPAQFADARQQAAANCAQVDRQPRLSNVTYYQRVLVVFDCQPPEDVRWQVLPPTQ
ncbi:MAG: hypothetical protein JO021_21560 [Alphaproteobacteria bacterium]|nr:hypothetical protein [Alphaproteobacteria bacterium]